MSLQYNSITEGHRQKHKAVSPDWQVGMFENVHSTWEKWEILQCRNKEWRQPNIGKTSNDARIITVQFNPLRGTVLPV